MNHRFYHQNRDITDLVYQFAQDTQHLLKDNLVAEYLFGSVARNEATAESDVDFLVIVKEYSYPIRHQLSELSSDYSLENDLLISAILKSVDVWEKNKNHNTLFYQHILHDGVVLC